MDAATAAGTVLNVLSVVDSCFHALHAARQAISFRKDYDVCLIRLDVACWKLSTWYEVHNNAQLDNDSTCRFFLSRIDQALSRAEQISEHYQASRSANAQTEPCTDTQTSEQLRHNLFALHSTIRRQIQGSHRALHLGGRILWVFYRKEDFDNVVEDITRSIDHLYACFPPSPPLAVSTARQSLVGSVKSHEQLHLLARASEPVDEALKAAATAAAKVSVVKGHIYTNFVNEGHNNLFGYHYEGQDCIPEGIVEGSIYKNFRQSGNYNIIGNRFIAR